MVEKETGLIVTDQQQAKRKNFGIPGWMLSGKIDGKIGNSLMEMKVRQNHFFNRIPRFEKIQCLLYLNLWDLDHLIYVQRFRKKIRTFDVFRDQEDIDMILFNLRSVIQEYFLDEKETNLTDSSDDCFNNAGDALKDAGIIKKDNN